MYNKLLFSLLIEISENLFKYGKQYTQANLPDLLCNILKAQGYAAYLQNDNDYLLHTYYSSLTSGQFANSWQQYGWKISTAAVFIDNQEEAGHFCLNMTWKRCLIVPLMGEIELEGVLLVGWTETSPFEYISQEELWILRTISQLLSQVYCPSSARITELQQREKVLLALYQKAEQELENSRKQVSLELHDEVGQVLTSVLLQLKMLQQAEDIEYIKGRLGGLHHITLQTLEEVRRISRNLRPGLLEKLGLQAAVEAHIKDYAAATGIHVEFRHHNLEQRLPDGIETIIYRAVQEGLTNVARHTKASRIIVSLSKKKDNVFLQILDNGQGMKRKENNGLGLLGIEERVKLANGRFWILSQRGKGLTLNILLPLV